MCTGRPSSRMRRPGSTMVTRLLSPSRCTEAWQAEQLLHGHLAAIDEHVRAFVLEGEGRAAERARDAVAALEAIGAPATLVPTRHPVVDIVAFQLLTVDLAEARGVDPDRIHRDDPRWARARAAYV